MNNTVAFFRSITVVQTAWISLEGIWRIHLWGTKSALLSPHTQTIRTNELDYSVWFVLGPRAPNWYLSLMTFVTLCRGSHSVSECYIETEFHWDLERQSAGASLWDNQMLTDTNMQCFFSHGGGLVPNFGNDFHFKSQRTKPSNSAENTFNRWVNHWCPWLVLVNKKHFQLCTFYKSSSNMVTTCFPRIFRDLG